jgi:Fur family peroxide stress response transcriptional regulator
MGELEERLEHIVRLLWDQGYRLTPQRMAILREVVYSHSHPTAEEMHRQVTAEFPMISLATVYKTLNVIKDLGEVIELKVNGCSHYDGNATAHPHLICVKCHSIADLPPESMAGMPEDALAETEFRAFRHDVKIYGLCPQCQEQEEDAVEPLGPP